MTLDLEDWPLKIGDSWVLGMYLYFNSPPHSKWFDRSQSAAHIVACSLWHAVHEVRTATTGEMLEGSSGDIAMKRWNAMK